MFFYKQLTKAEVGQTGTHEIYIRLSNGFDYETFFGDTPQVNENGTITIYFEAINTSKGLDETVNVPIRFVYYSNSNKEKRIPSLGELFKENNVEVDDIVCLESRRVDDKYSFYIRFFKKGTIRIEPSSFSFTTVGDENKENIISTNKSITPLQQIFYGAPGTGKSCGIKKALAGNNVPNENIFRTTFHPDSDYSTFVGAYKPTMEVVPHYESSTGAQIEEKRIAYNFIPQAFLNAYVRAYQTDENVYLVIEEINRGNCAQIFGDLFQLLDRGDDGKSDYSIKADTDIRTYLEEVLGDDNEGIKGGNLCLPANLYILATMNTSDQSLFPIDSAFKRRWEWEYVPIRNEEKGWVIAADGKEWVWWEFLNAVNEKIGSITDSEDKKLGYFFVKPADGHTITAKTFVGKVLFYLWNDVFKDYGFSDDEFQTEDGKEMKYPMFYETEGGKDVNERLIARFLSNLKLKTVDAADVIEEEITAEDDEA
jgi:ATPase associated with various cellular activities AAA_5